MNYPLLLLAEYGVADAPLESDVAVIVARSNANVAEWRRMTRNQTTAEKRPDQAMTRHAAPMLVLCGPRRLSVAPMLDWTDRARKRLTAIRISASGVGAVARL